MPKAITPPAFKLCVADYSPRGSGRVLGAITPCVGMHTRAGEIVGFTDSGKSMLLKAPGGTKRLVRAMDRLPGVTVTEARKWGFIA